MAPETGGKAGLLWRPASKAGLLKRLGVKVGPLRRPAARAGSLQRPAPWTKQLWNHRLSLGMLQTQGAESLRMLLTQGAESLGMLQTQGETSLGVLQTQGTEPLGMLPNQGAEPLGMAVAQPEQEMAAAQQREQEQGKAVAEPLKFKNIFNKRSLHCWIHIGHILLSGLATRNMGKRTQVQATGFFLCFNPKLTQAGRRVRPQQKPNTNRTRHNMIDDKQHDGTNSTRPAE